jgi:hypothetical protein
MVRRPLDSSRPGLDPVAVPTLPRRRIAGIALAAVLASGCQDPTLSNPAPRPYLLVEKGPYQSLYRADGTLERLVDDRNGDRTADAVILYGPDGTVRQAELDTNLDEVIDRWEYFDSGVLVRIGFTRRTPGVPDYWDVVAPDGAVTGREYDDDGDGKVDRSEPPS